MPANPGAAAPLPFRVENHPDGRHLALVGVVGAAHARALQDVARTLADAPGTVIVDMAELRHLDCAGVQVLLALDETLRRRESTLTYQSVPEGVEATFRNAGLGPRS